MFKTQTEEIQRRINEKIKTGEIRTHADLYLELGYPKNMIGEWAYHELLPGLEEKVEVVVNLRG